MYFDLKAGAPQNICWLKSKFSALLPLIPSNVRQKEEKTGKSGKHALLGQVFTPAFGCFS